MKLLPLALLGLAMTTSAVPEAATPSVSSTPTPSNADIASAAASDNSAVNAFTHCLWPSTDRIVGEIKGLSDLSFKKLIDELHWEIVWWGDPSKWVPDLLGIGLNATFVASCLLDVVGEGLACSTTDVLNQFLKTFYLIPKNATRLFLDSDSKVIGRHGTSIANISTVLLSLSHRVLPGLTGSIPGCWSG